MGEPIKSSVPLHNQIAHVLRLRLESGSLAENGAPATERALCEEFGVSRTTVRAALAHLKQAGLLASRRGVGTQGVAEPVRRHLVGMSVDPLHASLPTQSRVTALGEVSSRARVAAFFGIAAGSPVWHFVRIHSLAGKPLSVVDSYLPCQLGRSFSRAMLKTPMHDLLWRHLGIRQARSLHTIRVARADVDVAAWLEIALADPVLAVQARVYLSDGSPVRWIENSFREDLYEYVAEMDWPHPLMSQRPASPRRKRQGRA